MHPTDLRRSVTARPTAPVAAWLVAAVAILLALTAAAFHLADHRVHTDLTQWWLTNVAASVGLGVPGAMIAARRPRNPIGWILLTASMAQALTVAGREYAVYALAVHPGDWPGGIWGAWIGSWGYALTSLVGVAVLLFPTGRPKSWIWWIPVAMVAAGTAFLVFVSACWPGPILDGPGALNTANPLGWMGTIRVANDLGLHRVDLYLTVSIALAIAGLLARLPGAERDLRRQITVIALPTAVLMAESAGSCGPTTMCRRSSRPSC